LADAYYSDTENTDDIARFLFKGNPSAHRDTRAEIKDEPPREDLEDQVRAFDHPLEIGYDSAVSRFEQIDSKWRNQSLKFINLTSQSNFTQLSHMMRTETQLIDFYRQVNQCQVYYDPNFDFHPP